MFEHGLPALYTVSVWWFATGLILHLDGLRPETFRWSMGGATVALAAACWGLAASAADPSVGGAYLAFTCGLLVWGWVELSFLTGWLTGPRKTPCEPGSSGWPRFVAALSAILWHELAILAGAALVIALTWGGGNQIGTCTFLILWIMRLSAKLNVFLGVRNLAEEFLPDHLGHLRSFFRRRPMNALFPISAIGSTITCAALFETAFAPEADGFQAVGFTLLGMLMALAVLEHWFLVLPLPFEALWEWGLRSRKRWTPACTDAWDARLSGACDSGRLRALLDAVAGGAFGEVESLRGTTRAEGGWVRFGVSAGQASMAAFIPDGDEQPGVAADGRVDGPRLRAAFEACAVTRGAG